MSDDKTKNVSLIEMFGEPDEDGSVETTPAELLIRLMDQFQWDVFDLNKSNGFHAEGRDPGSKNFDRHLLLTVSEIIEAMEACRAGNTQAVYFEKDSRKPEGWATELADVVIRVMDIMAANDISLAQVLIEKFHYNATRPHLHGKQY